MLEVYLRISHAMLWEVHKDKVKGEIPSAEEEVEKKADARNPVN